MSDKYLVYRALMPDHYLPRVKGGDQDTSIDGSRKWTATRLPALRVFGPLWSFGLIVDELNGNAALPAGSGGKARLFELRALSAGGAIENKPLERLHPPQLFLARVESCLQAEFAGATATSNLVAESRLSTVALDTINAGLVNPNGEIFKPIPDGALAVKLGDKPVGGTPTVVLMPFGDSFDKPNTEPAGGALQSQYLPAMQLVHGRIRLASDKDFLKTARLHLGLGDPGSDVSDSTGLVLLDDGFALRGQLALPWTETKVISWFRVGLEGQGTAAEPVLTPWFDPDFPEAAAAQRLAWDAALDALTRIVAEAGKAEDAPDWLDVEVSDRIAAEDLTLPLVFRSLKPTTTLLNAPITVHRPDTSTFAVAGRALLLRLADRRQAQQPRASLTIEPRRFYLKAIAGELAITAMVEGLDAPPDGAVKPPAKAVKTDSATYAFTAAASKQEIVTLAGPSGSAVELAIPLLQTAAAMRAALDLPPPSETTEDTAWIWGFTPLDTGWLHWPMPNMTPQGLEVLLPPASAPKLTKNNPADGISGAMLFGNFPDAADRRTDHVSWSLAISEPRKADVSIRLNLKPARFTAAKVVLDDPALALDGMVPVVPFRQTEERLLPDHAERALAVRSLTALSPRLLFPRELDGWRMGTARMRLGLEGGAIAWTGKGNYELAATRMSVEVGLAKKDAKTIAKDIWTPPAPWLWTRHATLPAIQNLSRVTCGGSLSRPAEGRSLAPLRYREGTFTGFQFAPDMGRTDLRLLGLDSKLLERTPGTDDLRDLGMAVTTLPSVTLHPGMDTGPGLAGAGWNSLAAARIQVRHDIALADEANAFAVPPPPPPPPAAAAGTPGAVPAEPPPIRFAPQPDNGPGRDGKVAAEVWRALERKAALAALDRRDLVVGDKVGGGGKAALTGLWLKPAEGMLGFDPAVTATAGGLGAVGAWSFAIGGAGGTLNFAGLPYGGDHEGFSGSLAVDAPEFDLGTPVIAEGTGPFGDQTGLVDRGLLEADGFNNLLGERVRLYRDGGTMVRLLTLLDPVPVEGQAGLAFWCSDVPVPEGTTSALAILDADGDPADERRANGAAIGRNLLTGFRWALGVPGNGDDVVVVDGFSFSPQALTDAVVDADGNLVSVKIRGRLLLPLGDDAPSPDLPGGKAFLTLRASGKAFSAELTAEDIFWPLAAAGSATAPRLEIEVLPAPGATKKAILWSTVGGARWRTKIDVKRRAKADTTGPVLVATPGAVTGDKLSLGRTTLDLKIEAPGKPHVARFGMALGVGDGDFALRGTVALDLLGDGETRPGEAWELTWKSEDKAAEVPLAFSDAEGAALKLGAGGLALVLSAKAADGEGLLHPVEAKGGTISLVCGLVPALPSGDGKTAVLEGSPGFRATAIRLGARLEMGVEPDSLTLASGRRADGRLGARLFGSLKVENAFSWPRFETITEGDRFETAELPAGGLSRTVRHSATVRLDGAFLGEREGSLFAAATVGHVVTEGTEEIAWSSFQHVRFWTAPQFKAALKAREVPTDKSVKNLQKLATGFSPVGPGGPKNFSTLTAVGHFLHVSAANPGGVSGPLAAALGAAIGDRRILAVDLSGHHALFRDDRGEGFLLSLPALGLLGKAAPDVLSQKDVAAILATRPAKALQVAQPFIDGRRGRSLPALSDTQRKTTAAAIGAALQAASRSGISLAEAALGGAPGSEDVFQPVAMASPDGATWQTAGEWPGIGPAMQVSRFLGEVAGVMHPRAFRLATPPYLRSSDFAKTEGAKPVDLGIATVVDVDRLQVLSARLRARASEVFLFGPDAVGQRNRPEAPEPRVSLLVPALAGQSARLLAEKILPVLEDDGAGALSAPDRIDAEKETWARATLLRLAPEAACGLLEDGATGHARVIAGMDAGARPVARTQPLRQAAPPPARQRQRIAAAVALPGLPLSAGTAEALAARLRDGFLAVSVRPERIKSESDESETLPPDPRLSSAAVTVAMRLGAAETPVLGPEKGVDFWIAERQSAVFRPFAVDAAGKPMSFALPGGYGARLPAGVVPVRPEATHVRWEDPAAVAAEKGKALPDETVLKTRQSYLPARLLASTVAGRPGAMAIRRTGLLVSHAGGAAGSSERPVHLRLPRLPLLGRDDRPRASAIEPGGPWISTRASALVCGPAADAADDAMPDHALRLDLREPAGAVLGLDWDGRLVLAAGEDHGTGGATWTVEGMRLSTAAGSVLFEQAGKAPVPTAGGTLVLDLSAARLAVYAMPPASNVRLTLGLRLDQPPALRREVIFDLLTSGTGRPEPGPETPVFLRFEDPEYAATLVGVPRIERGTSPFGEDDKLLLAAERSTARPDDALSLIVALRQPDGTGPKVVDAAGKIQGLRLSLERQRPGQAAAATMKPDEPKGSGLGAFDEAAQAYAFESTGGPEAVVRLDLAKLSAAGTGDSLSPGDRLAIRVFLPAGGGPAGGLMLVVDIVAVPVFPANGSGFALLALSRARTGSAAATEAGVRVLLHASRPPAALIELVDPLDMLRGRVRRRATYLWRAFLAPEPGRERFLALQKIGQTTASWLPSAIGAGGWQEIP